MAALPPDVWKGSAVSHTKLNTKSFRLGCLPESRRLSAHQAAQRISQYRRFFHIVSSLGPRMGSDSDKS